MVLVSSAAHAQIAAPFPKGSGEAASDTPSEDDAFAPDEAATDEANGADQPWCTDGMEALTPTVCHYSPAANADQAPDTLVIFLHGVVKYGTTWQWNGEKAVARAAKANGFEAIMPRGRLGAGSKKFADHWNWPSSVEGQRQFEEEVLAEWMSAKQTLEARNGRPFARVYIFGFSAGAYYATSLALRGKIHVDGYGIFAGGGAPGHVERWAKGIRPKPPIYVGFGYKDKAHKDPEKLGRALRAMSWPSRVVGKKGVGHSMTDAGVREAIAFLANPSSSGHHAATLVTAAKTDDTKRVAHAARKKPRRRQTAKAR